MIINKFHIYVKEHKKDWYANGYTIEIPYKLKPGDYVYGIRWGRDSIYVCRIVEINDELMTVVFINCFGREKGFSIISKLIPESKVEPFPMFNYKPDFRAKTNLDFYFGNLAGSAAAKRKIEVWQRNFNNLMQQQLSMF